MQLFHLVAIAFLGSKTSAIVIQLTGFLVGLFEKHPVLEWEVSDETAIPAAR